MPTWQRRLRHSVRRLGLGIVGLLVLEYLVLPELAGARESLHLLAKVNLAYLALGLALEGASSVGARATTVVHPVGTVTPDDKMRAYEFDLAPEIVAWASSQEDPIRLSLKVPTWIPADVLPNNSDTRDLGVMIARVTVR
jgi:hypothetical protein